MQFHFNSDNQTVAGAEVAARVEEIARARVARVANRLTRVEVHLGEADGGQAGGDEISCMIEARPSGMAPVSASHHSPDIEAAVTGAADKLLSVLTGRSASRRRARATDLERSDAMARTPIILVLHLVMRDHGKMPISP